MTGESKALLRIGVPSKGRLAEIAARGDPPTRALDPAWRERAEDFVWALFNMPEFVFVP